MRDWEKQQSPAKKQYDMRGRLNAIMQKKPAADVLNFDRRYTIKPKRKRIRKRNLLLIKSPDPVLLGITDGMRKRWKAERG